MSFERLLANVSRHITLSKEEIDFFLPLLNTRSLQAGEFLLREGEVCRYQSFITRGCLKTYYVDEGGNENIVDFLVEDWWADDLYSFLTGTPAQSNIRAIESADLLQISKANLELLYQKVPVFERFFRILFQNAYISQKKQINQFLSATAEERYRLFLESKPYAAKRFPQKDIASYLGVTPQFLSALKKKMRKINVD